MIKLYKRLGRPCTRKEHYLDGRINCTRIPFQMASFKNTQYPSHIHSTVSKAISVHIVSLFLFISKFDRLQKRTVKVSHQTVGHLIVVLVVQCTSLFAPSPTLNDTSHCCCCCCCYRELLRDRDLRADPLRERRFSFAEDFDLERERLRDLLFDRDRLRDRLRLRELARPRDRDRDLDRDLTVSSMSRTFFPFNSTPSTFDMMLSRSL